jgi:D,D-heptose 1,7-bisphosphate phosphatase
MKKAIFLDKDGTLIKDVPYNIYPSLIEMESTAIEALELLAKHRYIFIVVSNQSGVARGFFEPTALNNVEAYLDGLLKKHNIKIAKYYYCYHHPEGKVPEFTRECLCRKPQPGLLVQAAEDFDIDLSKSWMIGDILNDIEAGKRARCRTVLVDHGNETEWNYNELRTPDYYAANLLDAASYIIQEKDVINFDTNMYEF